MGGFNADVSDALVTSFCTLFKLKGIAKEPTCYKNPQNLSCIDLFFEPLPPKIIKYRNYKKFVKGEFRFLFKKRLNDFNTDYIALDIVKMTFLDVLNKFASLKKKYLRANHSRFINKELHKAIMQRSRLRNTYLKIKLKQLG